MLSKKEGSRPTLSILAKTALLTAGYLLIIGAPLLSIQGWIRSVADSNMMNFKYITLYSLFNRFQYGFSCSLLPPQRLEHLVIGIALIAAVVFSIKVVRNFSAAFADPFNLVFLLFVLVLAGNLLQMKLLPTVFLEGRAALIYYMMFILLFIFILREIAQFKLPGISFAYGALYLLLLLNLLRTTRLGYFYDWSYDAFTYRVIEQMELYRQQHPELKNVEMKTRPDYACSIGFYTETGKYPWLTLTDDQGTTDTSSTTTFYYLSEDDTSKLHYYRPVAAFIAKGWINTRKPGQILMMRE